jgi:hypothetical protein
MTTEKYYHYIGKDQTEFIMSQPLSKLEEMKTKLLYEFNHVEIPPVIFIRYTFELMLIRNLIRINKTLKIN